MKTKVFLIIFIISLLVACDKKERIDIENKIVVHYIDVGQGDASLIRLNNLNLLIDSGPKEEREKLLSFLKLQKIDKIDYLIATHPHEDHIGNMAYIIDNFSVEKFYSPKVESTSKSFESMVESLKRNSLKINVIKEGSTILSLGKNSKVSIFSPNASSYDNLNNYSPIIKISYNNSSFLFTGDAERVVEKDVLAKNSKNLSSDIIKLGHHGSKTSSSKDFIEAVNPSIAIISCGKDNGYGHPHKETLSLLNNKNIKSYSTAEDGSISFYSDGNKIYPFK